MQPHLLGPILSLCKLMRVHRLALLMHRIWSQANQVVQITVYTLNDCTCANRIIAVLVHYPAGENPGRSLPTKLQLLPDHVLRSRQEAMPHSPYINSAEMGFGTHASFPTDC